VLYHRLATKTALIDLSHPSSYSLERNADSFDKLESDRMEDFDHGAAAKDLFDAAGVDLEDLETFGTDSTMRVANCHNKLQSSSAAIKNPNNVREVAKTRTSISQSDCLIDSGDSTDEEDAKLAIDLDSPMTPIMSTDGQFDDMTPIMSTDGQFDDKDDSAGSAKRQSRRIALKRQRTSTTSSNEAASLSLNRSLSIDETHGDSIVRSEVQSSGDHIQSPTKLSADDNVDSCPTLSVVNYVDSSVQKSTDKNVEFALEHSVVDCAHNFVSHITDREAVAESVIPWTVSSPCSTPSCSREDTEVGSGTSVACSSKKLPVTVSTVKNRRARTITQRRLSESPLDPQDDPPMTHVPSLSKIDVSSKCLPPVSTSTLTISASSSEIRESLSSASATDRQIHCSVASVGVKTKITHVLAECIAAAETVEGVKRKRGRPRKDETVK